MNSGEAAFNAKLYLRIPFGVNFINANSSNTEVTVLCSPPTHNNNRTLECEVGNPLPAGKKVRDETYMDGRVACGLPDS